MKVTQPFLKRVPLGQLVIEKWVKEKENKGEHVSEVEMQVVQKKLAEYIHNENKLEKCGKKKQKLNDVDSLIDYSKLVKGCKKPIK